MTPERYVQCLEILRWSNETLAKALGCDKNLTEAWALGVAEVPLEADAWLEELTLAHQALEDERPTPLSWDVDYERELM